MSMVASSTFGAAFSTPNTPSTSEKIAFSYAMAESDTMAPADED